jgi:hypothetical protein
MNGQTSQFISFYEVSEKVMRFHIFASAVVVIRNGWNRIEASYLLGIVCISYWRSSMGK